MRLLAAALLAGCATGTIEPDAGQGGPIDAAQGGNPDARRFPDAMQPIDSAVVPTIDAMETVDADTGCTVQTVNLLGNSNFDSGDTVWTTVSTPDVYPVILSTSSSPYTFPYTPHTGIWGAWLGGVDSPDAGDETRYVWQQISVPADATNLSISGQRWFESEDFGDFDQAAVRIISTSNTVLQEVFLWNADDITGGWTAFSGALNNYAGQTIKVYLISWNDSSLNTNFFFDTVSFNATVCQ
jgi:hypothetical protein